MAGMTPEKIGLFVNDYLRKDLQELEHNLNIRNAEMMEFIQLKNMIQTIMEHLSDGFKTQMNIGGNIFMEAKVPNAKTILVNVGKDIYVDFTLEEALKFIDFKIKVLNKETDVIREESIKKKVDIKLALMCIGDKQRLHQDVDRR